MGAFCDVCVKRKYIYIIIYISVCVCVFVCVHVIIHSYL